MRLRVLCVGKPRDRELAALHDRYAERIRRFGVRYETASVAEVQPGTRYADHHVRQREARRLSRALDEGCTIALDAAGKMLSSEELAANLERWGTRCATFVIGGPLGLDPGLHDRADAVWSLSRLTFPHELARVLVAEQLYRALCILRRVPYHK